MAKKWNDDLPFVFVSYAHRNKEEAMRIIGHLRETGHRVWCDAGIDPGTEWAEGIAKRIEHCTCFIALISASYLASSNCRDEINYARKLEKRRLLVYLENVELTGGLSMQQSSQQAIHKYAYKEEANFYEKLSDFEPLEQCQMTDPETLYKQGLEYHGCGAYADALRCCLAAAEQGHAWAQYMAGFYHCYGMGVAHDGAQAVSWYRKAAEQNISWAHNELGKCHQLGTGVAQDHVQAAKWFRSGAELGDHSAQYNLAVCYHSGDGVEQNPQEAAAWFRKAAEQGHADAQCFLAWCYGSGAGVACDSAEAVKWYRAAAEQGHSGAQYNLAVHCENGTGTEKNLDEAVKWYRAAAEQGDENAKQQLDRLTDSK